jgi:hypothetical protein
MNLGRLRQELRLAVADSSLAVYFTEWINDAILELATDFDLPALKRRTPYPFTVSTADWLFAAPACFHKKIFQARDSDYNAIRLRPRGLADLDLLDYDHDDAGDHVTDLAWEESGTPGYVGVFPKANETINLWFYEPPATLVNEADEPVCIPAPYRARVILPKVIIKNFRLLQDMSVDPPHDSLKYWEAEYAKGLYGGARGDIGLINYLARAQGGPRRHGGRDPLP